jgi:putative (di)nucleoside polyphosphate hydrolase
MSNKDLPYRLGVGLVLFNAQGLVFAARRIDTELDAWQMPQGGIDKGEEPEVAALRELEEEIGTAKAEIIAETKDWLAYDLPKDLAAQVWKGKYRGQKQKWYALRFLGDDSDINIATEHPEFSDWTWMPLAEVVEKIVPFKRDIYRAVAAEFLPLADRIAKGI